VYNRFYELGENLKVIRERLSEFSEKPTIIVLWARPQRSREYFIEKLVEDGFIDFLIYRPELTDESKNTTTYAECRNIRIVSDFITNFLGSDYYLIYQSADIRPQPGTYKLIEQEINNGNQTCVWHWDNGIVPQGCYHTNFFATKLDKQEYLPPITDSGCSDVLEWAWGKQIPRQALYVTHNARERHFVNRHETEHNCVPPRESVYFYVSGRYKTISERVLQWLKLIYKWIQKPTHTT
jgi:hypothetical protein